MKLVLGYGLVVGVLLAVLFIIWPDLFDTDQLMIVNFMAALILISGSFLGNHDAAKAKVHAALEQMNTKMITRRRNSNIICFMMGILFFIWVTSSLLHPFKFNFEQAMTYVLTDISFSNNSVQIFSILVGAYTCIMCISLWREISLINQTLRDTNT